MNPTKLLAIVPLLAALCAPISALAATQATPTPAFDPLNPGAGYPNRRCWQGQSNCWDASSYAFPDLPVWSAEPGCVVTDGTLIACKDYPPPTAITPVYAGGSPQFATDSQSMYWGQIPFDGRWAWLNRPSAFASSYERGPSVGGAFGALAGTQDGMHMTPPVPCCALDHFFNADGTPKH